jgi:sugar O-acyltransferase (sialic acid O-acetyltransferase NeuD family)
MRDIVIYGAGGHARELLFQLQAEHGASSVVAIVDDFEPDRTVCGLSTLGYEQAAARYRDCLWFVAVGDNPARTRLLEKIKAEGIELGRFVSSRAFVAPGAKIHPATQVFAGSVISDNCELSENVLVNFNCVVSHDVKIGANSLLAACTAIAGHVTVGEGVWIGVGARISNGKRGRPLTIGDRAVVGAGACVIADVPSGRTVVGVPANPKGRQP